jgi:3',5'-cyclic AMP phosphodiesterase CpdA
MLCDDAGGEKQPGRTIEQLPLAFRRLQMFTYRMTHRAAWLTDIHLNFVARERVADLAEGICHLDTDSILVGGDIGEADNFAGYLVSLAEWTARPTYFVLGNHDYYRGSIVRVHETARQLSRANRGLTWLPAVDFVELSASTALVGHDGWGDGRAANFMKSDLMLNDYRLIDELRACHSVEGESLRPGGIENGLLKRQLLLKLNALGDEAAAHFTRVLPLAANRCRYIVVLTHVPPFREACWHEGRLSDDEWAPHFTCLAVGDVLREFMQRHTDHQMTVLCGHTHSGGKAQILENLTVLTGAAKYGAPRIQQILELE